MGDWYRLIALLKDDVLGVVGFDGYGEKARVFARLNELEVKDWIFEEPMNDVDKW